MHGVQVPIFDLLKKFDGHHTSDDIKAGRRRFRLTKLPSYMVLHIKRFTKNNFFVEKNPTIVNFPVKNLELRDILPVPTGELTNSFANDNAYAAVHDIHCSK